jgi:leucine dehydrogenase
LPHLGLRRADDALTDALRLSRGMTYKNAMADLPLGGGKAVIYKHQPDRVDAFEKFGERSKRIGGRYITAEDVGAGVERHARDRAADHLRRRHSERGRPSGRRSQPMDGAWHISFDQGAYWAALCRGAPLLCRASGAVGFNLCKLLSEEGAKLSRRRREQGTSSAPKPSVRIAPVDQIHAVKADVFAPCALGAGLNPKTIPELGAPIICGAANNQLATEADGEAPGSARHHLCAGLRRQRRRHHQRFGRISGRERSDAVEARVRAIAPRVLRVLDIAKSDNITPHQAADRIVRER